LTLLERFVKTRSVTRATKLAISMAILAVGARFVLIDQPYIDNWSWRQSDVAAIARNYLQNGFQFARPQIDWAGDQPGYVGTEFPILPFLAAICYRLFGVHEWIGRAQAVILFAVSLPFLFLLVRDLFGAIAASWALLFYSFAPLNVFAGREFMPDVPSLSFALIGLYFFHRWIAKSELAAGRVRVAAATGPDWPTRSTSLFAAAAAISLALLIKLPTVVIGAPLLCLCWQKWRWNFLRQRSLWLFAAITLLPSAVWYWHAHQIAQRFYPHHFFGAGGIRIENFSWYWKIAKEVATSSLTPLLLILGLTGLFVTRSTRGARLFQWWLAAMILFIIVVGYGNRHPWYQLPLVPIAAVFAGGACAFLASKISSRPAKVVLSIFLVISFGNLAFLYTRPFYRSPSSAASRDAGLKLKETTPKNSLIVAADIGDPTIFYYAERKGWHFLEKGGVYNGNPNDSEQLIVDLEQLRRRGATHLVFTSNTSWWLDYYREFAQHVDATATLMKATSEFRIYKLKPATE
jgi:4-amino-4-deoxy-L-arabinose transferase-like glycosyltransferase